MVTKLSIHFPLSFLNRTLRPSIAAVFVLTSVGFLIPSAFAQKARSLKVTPANEKELMAYLGISTQSLCIALDSKIELPKAAIISMRPTFGVIKDLHGSRIPARRKKFSDEELGKWVESQVFLRASDMCPKLLPAEITDRAEEIKQKLKSR